ncbi:hypothetical protein Tco_1304009 [Tanacetum coccineum]
MTEPQGEQSNEQAPLDTESIPSVSYVIIVHSSVDKPSEDEPPVKKLTFLIPYPSIPLLTPLSSLSPQDFKQKARPNLSIEQFTKSLFQTTSSDFSPTPPKYESKGKGLVVEEEPLKQLILLIDQSQAQLNEMKRLTDLKAEQEKSEQKLKALSKQELKAQATKLAEYKAKRAKILEEYNYYITFRADPLPITKISYKVDSSKQASIRITRGNKLLNLTVIDKFIVKMLGFTEWLELHALASRSNTKEYKLLLKILKAKLQIAIQKGSPEAEEMFVKLELTIEARSDVTKDRKIAGNSITLEGDKGEKWGFLESGPQLDIF